MKRLFVGPYIVWLAIFVVVPLFLVVYYAFTTIAPDGQATFTTAHFIQFFQGLTPNEPFFQRLYIRVAVHSVYLAFLSTVICFVLGYPLAYILASKGFRDKSFLLFMFIAPMWMNFLVRTYAWLTILERHGLVNTILQQLGLPIIDILFTDAAVLLGMVYNFLPFMVLPIYTSLVRIDNKLIEAAQDLGASPAHVFLRVIFPLSIPGVVSGITMVFMPGAATFIISNLLGGAQYFLLGNLIEQQFLRVGNWHFGAVVAVVLMILMIVSMAVLRYFDKSELQEEGVRV